ncbi:hypothetical protein, partial [Robinsoniella peoriensis]|uniref:hypothetical protein n=1 Tax=Robinsoniella peoriensis TaxID=180332 RepID=UPI001A9A3F2F
RAAKKGSGKVRKYQFCGKPSKSMSWLAPSLSVHYLSYTKRLSSAKPKFKKQFPVVLERV